MAGQAASGGSAAQLESLFNALTGGAPSGSSSNSDVVGQLIGALLQGRSLPQVGLEDDEAEFLDAQLIQSSADYLTENRFDPSELVWSEKDGQRVLSLSEEQWALVRDIELNVFVDDGQGYVDLGLDNVFEFNADGDLLGQFDGTWLTVNGQAVPYYLLETRDDGSSLGRIPAMLNGRRVELMVSFPAGEDGEILGAMPCYDEDTETSTVARGLLELQDGDVLDFVCGCYDYERNYDDAYYLGEPLTVDGPLELVNLAFDNENYIAAYRITDIYNNHYWTPAL